MSTPSIERTASGFAGGRPNDTRYDPTYDPLVSPVRPAVRADLLSRRPAPAADDGPVTRDLDVDVAIIGAGYTGLATALCLARDHGIKAVVLEANRTSWAAAAATAGRAERIGPAVALAVDRALGQGRRAEDARRDPRRLRELQVARGGNRLRPAAWRPFPDRASSAHHGQARGRGEGVEGRIRLSVRAAERRNLPPRIHQRPRSGRRAARAGRHRHPRAEARVRLPAPRARSRREGAYEQPGARLRDDRRRASPAHARRRRAGLQSASRPARTPRRRCIRRCAAR